MANAGRRDALLLRGLFAGGAPRGPSRLVERFVRELGEQEALFAEGDAGAEMYYVQSGEIALRKGGRELKRAGPGEYFGEMSMLIHAPRTASAIATAPATRLIVITQENFDTLLRENPGIVRSILKEMALRLRATSERVA
jgi:CRP-like cAMP-binding protein